VSAIGSAAPAGRRALADDAARAAALLDSHRTLLVEAGAGSGKTSLMAGRVALLLAAGAAPRSIAAITFTELAAADLAARIRSFVTRLLAGDVPPELTLVLPQGLEADARERLARAEASLDDLTSTTIHGFCRDLVRPYPVEADVDPGARVLDALESELLFEDVRERWLRQRLADGARGPVAAMVAVDLKQTLRLLDETVALVRAHREVRPPAGGDVAGAWRAFSAAVADVEAAIGADAPAEALPFRDAARTLRDHLTPHAADPAALSLAALTLPDTYLRVTRDGDRAFRRYRTKGAWTRVDRARGATRHAQGEAALDALEAAEAHLCGCAAAHAMQALLVDLADLRAAYADAKRASAALDFDDLLLTADRLLREHPRVRRAAASRYRHVLVDEFQDTDPLQASVLWRLCGDPPDDEGRVDPLAWRLRPGALFVVGDPKQSIYRFRGADVDAYREARVAIAAADPQAVLSVRTNFRSLPAILAYANERFAEPLSRPGQSGFEPLAPWRDGDHGP
jgi:ATP-dependent exoDNAse (exonuclease V) beta subunit